MIQFSVLPPLGSTHDASALLALPNVALGSQALLYHQDQVQRFCRWHYQWVDLKDLDLDSPQGSEHGLVTVNGINRTVTAGWDHIRQARAKGLSRVAAFVGQWPNPAWSPQSLQEQHNQHAFGLLGARKAPVKKKRSAIDDYLAAAQKILSSSGPNQRNVVEEENQQCTFVSWFSDHGVDPNAADKNGVTLLSHALVSGNLRLALFLLEQGALPHRLSADRSNPLGWSEVSPFRLALRQYTADTMAVSESLAVAFVKASAVINPNSSCVARATAAFPESLAIAFVKAAALVNPGPTVHADLEAFFKNVDRADLTPGAERLWGPWRASLLDQGLPSVSTSPRKPRF